MKKNYFSVIAACSALILSAACNKEGAAIEQPVFDEAASLKIKISEGSGFATRAGGYEANYEPVGKEATIKDVQLFIFDSDEFEKYIHVSDWSSEVTGGGSLNVGVKLGTKKVVALCNAPDFSTEDDYQELCAKALELGACNDPETGFVMSGEKSCTVTGANAACAIEVSRFVSKVYIGRIRNNLPPQFGEITLLNAYLANVPSCVSVGGTVDDNYWINKYGRKDETPLVSSHIIDGKTYLAGAPSLTFLDMDEEQIAQGDSTAAFRGFYSYANSHVNVANEFSATFAACCTKLVIAAQICGETNWYSINMGQIGRNHVYAVFLTISGLGSEDPAVSVVKGSIQASISVAPWQESDPIIEDI